MTPRLKEIRLHTSTGGHFYVDPKHADELALAVDAFIDSGRTKNGLLRLDGIEGHGARLHIMASEIVGWYEATEESEAAFDAIARADRERREWRGE